MSPSRPRFRVSAEVLAKALRGEPSATLSVPTKASLHAGVIFDVDLELPGGQMALGRVEVVAVTPPVAPGAPSAITLRIVSATPSPSSPSMPATRSPSSPAPRPVAAGPAATSSRRPAIPVVVAPPPAAPVAAAAPARIAAPVQVVSPPAPQIVAPPVAASQAPRPGPSPIGAPPPAPTLPIPIPIPIPPSPAAPPASSPPLAGATTGFGDPWGATPAPGIEVTSPLSMMGAAAPGLADPWAGGMGDIDGASMAGAAAATPSAAPPPSGEFDRAPGTGSGAAAAPTPSGEIEGAAAAGSEAPPGPQPAARAAGVYSVASRANLPEEIRRPAELCAEYTRDLVKLLNRTQYYGAQAKTRDAAVLPHVFSLIEQMIGDRHEFGYVLERSGETVDILVDGIGEERRKLGAILRPEIYDTFVPKLIDYFEKYQLVTLAFRRGIRREEWETVLELMSSMQVPDAAKRLSAEFLARGVVNVSILTTADLVGKDYGIPWQIRVCLARMTRDLKTLPMLQKSGPDQVRTHRIHLITDAVRPFQSPQHLKVILVYCPTVQDQADKIQELEGRKLEEIICEVIRPGRLAAAARGLFDDIKQKHCPDEPFGEARYQTVLLTSAVFLGQAQVEEGYALLRDLYAEGMLRYESLPPGLQEWVDAEDLTRKDNPIAEPPRSGDVARHVRVVSKAARLLTRAGQHDKVLPILEWLIANQGPTAEPFLDAVREAAPHLVERYCTGNKADREGLGLLIKSIGAEAAPAAVDSLLATGDHAAGSVQFQLLSLLGKSTKEALKAALARAAEGPPPSLGIGDPVLPAGIKPGPLRALLMLGAKIAEPDLADLYRVQLRHADARVRGQALAAFAPVGGADARAALVLALGDRDENVASQGLLLLALRKEAAPEADARCAKILTEGEPSSALVTALRYAAVTRDGAVREALGDCVDREQGGGGLRRLIGGGGGARRPEVLLAAVPALAAFGDTDRLKKLAKSNDPSVRNAADAALGGR